MTERGDIARIVADCERYWRETGVPRRAVGEMRLELEQHLAEAVAEGREPQQVTGSDLGLFAETWASEYRPARSGGQVWADVTTGRVAARRSDRRTLLTYAAGAASLVLGVWAGSALSGGGDTVDDEIWRWVWTFTAVAMGIGEIFTAGFFLLPFAVGAAAAAILAWLGVNLVAQWLVFFGVSLISLTYLRRFIGRQDELEQPRVGANRWVGARGIVITAIDPDTGSGMVRIDNEEWRAIADHDIPEGAKIRVREVRGSRLMVDALEDL